MQRIGKLLTTVLVCAALGCGGDDDENGMGNGDGGNGNGNGDGGMNEFGDGGMPPENCKKVDLVISVDNSGSMQEEKAALRDDVFPAMATALRNVGGGLEDYRVGVLDACPNPANFHTRGVSGPCNFESGQCWMDSNSSNLVAEFQCVGELDSTGTMCSGQNDDEQPASTAAAALEPAFSGPGKHNAGFLRDDALLVVMALTDEDEQPTPNASAQEVYDRLVAIKGDVKRMVFLGVGGSQDCDGVYGSAREAAKLKTLTDLFIAEGRGVFWDLCQGRLEDGLTEAMMVIEQACQELPPIP